MKFGSKLLCVLLLLMSIMVSSASTVVAADSFANDVAESAKAEPDLLMESKFHNTLAQSSDFARVSFTDANVADSFISASFISGFFAMIYGVLLAEGVITSSTVLTASVISANIGVLAGSSVVSSFFIAMIPILTPILYLVLGVVGFAVTLYVIDQVSRASNDIVESLILSLVDFFGNSTSSSINLDKDFTSDVAGSTEFISRSFSTDRVASLDDYTGDISVTASSNGFYYLNTNDWTHSNRVPGIYPMIYDEYNDEYAYANHITLLTPVPTRTLTWYVTNEEGYHSGGRSNEYNSDISQVEKEMMALNGVAALKAYQNVAEYPILYSTTGDLSDLVDVNNELKGYVSNKKAMVEDAVNATDSDTIEVQNVTPSSIAGYVGDRSVKLSDDLKIVDSITGDVLSDSMTGVKLGVDDSLSGNWLDDTFFIGATELEWDADGTGQIKDKRTGDVIDSLKDIVFKGSDLANLLKILESSNVGDITSDNYYIYDFVDLIKDEFGRGHTIDKHIAQSDDDLLDRLIDSGRDPDTSTWAVSRLSSDKVTDFSIFSLNFTSISGYTLGVLKALIMVNTSIKGQRYLPFASNNQRIIETNEYPFLVGDGYGFDLNLRFSHTGRLVFERVRMNNSSSRNFVLITVYPVVN